MPGSLLANSSSFSGYALGSLMEMETQVIIAQRLGFFCSEESRDLLGRTAEVGKIVNGLLRSLPRGH
jgi:four helix bundle protein